jgi:hypothetical protein
VLLRLPFLSAVKQVVSWEGIECGEVLPPRIGLTGDQKSALRKALEQVLTPATA